MVSQLLIVEVVAYARLSRAIEFYRPKVSGHFSLEVTVFIVVVYLVQEWLVLKANVLDEYATGKKFVVLEQFVYNTLVN